MYSALVVNLNFVPNQIITGTSTSPRVWPQEAFSYQVGQLTLGRGPADVCNAGIVHVADVISNGLGVGSSGEKIIPQFDYEIWEDLKISPQLFKPAVDLAVHQLASLELLKLDFSENEKVVDDIDYIQPAIQRMTNLASQLLAYARGGKYHPQKICISSFVKDTLPTIYLPAADDVLLPEKDTEASVVLGTETILMVEDEAVVVEVSRKMLTRLGYQTLVAQTGEEAIKISNNSDEKFDLVLLDMKLPDLDGKEIFSAIRAARPDIKVIIFSGYSIDGPVQEILDAGADGFIQKPFPISTLSTKLREVLGKG